MKKTLGIWCFFLLLFTGCQEDVLTDKNTSANELQSIEIRAEIDDDNANDKSRIYLKDHKYYWHGNDAISVFMGVEDENVKFSVARGENTQVAAFKGDVIIWGSAPDSDETGSYTNVAYYPYNDDIKKITKNGDVYTLSSTLPNLQYYGGNGTFGQNSFPLIAVTESYASYDFKFKPISSIVLLHVKGSSKINKVVMKANGKKIAGEFTVSASYSEKQPTVVTGNNATDNITLECTEPVQLSEENVTVFGFAALPVSFDANDISFDIYDTEGGIMKDAYVAKSFGELNWNIEEHFSRNTPVVYQANSSIYPVMIGKTGYQTLDEALAAAEDGDVITVVEGEYVLPSQLNSDSSTKTVTFKGLGENYTTVLSFNSQPGGADGGLNCYADNMSLIFENLKVVSPNTGNSYTGGFGRAKSVIFNNCEFVGQYRAVSAATTFNECTIDPQTSYIYTDYADATFNKCTFNASEGKGIQVYNDGSTSNTTITITECNFIAAKQATTWDGKPVTAIDINSNGEVFNVKINNTTTTGFGKGLYSGSDLWNIKGGEKYVNLAIDGVKYITSAESLANSLKAEDNEINVILLSDIDVSISSLGQQTGGSGEYKLGGESTSSISIDLNEKKLNITTTYWSAIGAKNENATFTIKNGTMTSSQESGTWNSCDLTFANCNYNIEDVVFEKAVALTNSGKTVYMKNVDINETHDYYALWISAVGQTVNIDGGKITSAGRGIKIDDEYANEATALVNLSVKNYDFETVNKGAILVKSPKGANITLNNVDISKVASDTEYEVWCDEDAADYSDLITVTGGDLKVEGTTPIADGVLLNAKGEYEISKKAGLEWLANQVNADNRLTGKIVKLTADIDLNNENWTPIGNTAGNNYSHNFEGTFDGNGKTISNLAVNNNKCAGFFGKMCKGTIKNLTIDGATLTTNHYAGAVVAWMEQGGGTFTLDNCHVKNVTITVTPDGTEGAYDNGDKAGALVGFMRHGSITNCTATNVTATAYRDLGGIVGYVYNSTVSGNKVNGAKLTIDQVTNYYEDKAANVGQIIGRRDGTPNESNNTYSNVTIETKTAQDGNFNKPVVGGNY